MCVCVVGGGLISLVSSHQLYWYHFGITFHKIVVVMCVGVREHKKEGVVLALAVSPHGTAHGLYIHSHGKDHLWCGESLHAHVEAAVVEGACSRKFQRKELYQDKTAGAEESKTE